MMVELVLAAAWWTMMRGLKAWLMTWQLSWRLMMTKMTKEVTL
jgi:hypothetical protein